MKSRGANCCYRFLLYWFLFVGSVVFSNAQTISNYGIEGWAACTPGGRGGEIIRVTNLNASGAGSFVEAVKQAGARIVVFEVSGVIDLGGTSVGIRNPFLTVAGQSAPGKGITLVNGGLSIHAHDVIIQHIRIRPGAEGHEMGSWEPDGLSTVGAYNVVIDHCSFSWAVDENCSASGDRFKGETLDDWRMNTSHDITISNCIIAEALSNATHSKGEHSKGTLIHDNATNIAILHNLYSCNKDRNPLFKGGARGVVVNNYIYNPGTAAIAYVLNDSEWIGYEHQFGQLTLVGNYLKYGSNTSTTLKLLNVSKGICSVFMEDNISERNGEQFINESRGNFFRAVNKVLWNDNIRIRPASEVLSYVLNNAGARPWNRDEVDTRIVEDVLHDTGKIIDNESEVGGMPVCEAEYQNFIDGDWNLEYMLKLETGIDLLKPKGWPQLIADSLYRFEARVDSHVEPFQSLDLLVDGVSLGKQYDAPFMWECQGFKSGNHELLLVVDTDSCMKRASQTFPFHIDEPVGAVNNIKMNDEVFLSLHPNPFEQSTRFSVELMEYSRVYAAIYNDTGKLVEVLIDDYREAGVLSKVWSPNATGRGIYYLNVRINEATFCRRLVCF